MKKNKFPAATIIFIAAGLLFISVALFFSSAYMLPVNKKDFSYDSGESYRIKDRSGRLIRESAGSKGERSQYIKYDDISPLVIKASVSIEDKNFYSHKGIDILSMMRALWQNVSSGKRVSGASTITMQLARIITKADRNIPGKIVQVWTALRIERVYSKDEIIEMYLNWIPYGNGAIGIESASRTYFGKPSSHLDLSEAAFLAGLPQAPSFLNPFKNPDNVERRRIQVLRSLADNGYSDKEEIERALAEKPAPEYKPQKIISGHFSDYVLSLDPPPGNVITTLDGDLNEQIQNMVSLHVDQYREKGLTNAAVVMIDNPSGEIRVLVGSRDWSDPIEGSVNGVLARRQPGSALKPFAYELAVEKGVKTNIVLADIETEYYGTDKTLYIPQNYSRTYRGPVIFQEALSLSLNIPSIRLVSEYVGLDSFLSRLRDLGFSGLNENKDYYGLGLVLGNGEVSPLEIAGAYSVLARGGILINPTPFPGRNNGKRIMDEKSSFLITSILSDETLRIQSFGISNPLLFGLPLAVKTGTSNQWRDTWTAGYTSEFTLVVWAGNFNADPMDGLSGAMGAGVLFGKIIRLLSSHDRGLFKLPSAIEGLKKIEVCSWSGLLPNEYCSKLSSIYTYDDIRETCGVHKKVLSAKGKETIVSYLPPEYDGWLKEKGFPMPPSKKENKDKKLRILKPREGDRYIIEPGYDIKTQTVEFLLASSERPSDIRWYLNNELVATRKWPYFFDWKMQKGKYSLEARYSDEKSDQIHFEVK